jgi:lysine 6-dehydrogenase
MARTTGYTATLAIRMIAEGLYTHKGISPPEYMGKYQACIDYMQKGLKERNVNWEISEEKF